MCAYGVFHARRLLWAEDVRLSRTRHVPMIITLFRFLLGPVFAVVFSRWPGAWGVLLLIVGAAIFSDWLDGFLARRLGAVSTGGKLLDPFADAMFCMIVFCLCWRSGLVPGWVVGVLIGREALVTFVVRPVALRNRAVIAASMMGKVKTSFQFGIIVTFVVLQREGFFPRALLQFLISLGFYIVLFLSVLSAAIYACRVVSAARGKQGACVGGGCGRWS